jgi:hypothetical protein
MSTPKGIEERIHAKADKALAEAVDTVIAQCNNELNRVLPGNYATHSEVNIKKTDDVVVNLTAQRLLNTIGAALTKQGTDKHREIAVKAFMEKVDTLHDQIDELRDEVNYHEHD